MKAVVLVGGEGTRLRPLTFSTPKQMLPVAEVTMIERVLAHLALHGVDEAVLSIGYRPDAFLTAFPQGTCAGLALAYAVEPEPLDTGGAIAFAARAAGITETFLAVNGDVLTDLDVTSLVTCHRDRRGEATIALTPVDDPSSFGVVPTDDDGRVVAFVEKPGPGAAPTNFVNAGAYVLEPSVLDRIPPGRRVSIEREVFPALAASGAVYGLRSTEYWTDTGTAELYLKANLDLVSGARGQTPAPGAKEREPGVWTLGAAVIDGDVIAPALVGDAAFIGGDAVVDGSVVGAGARVEAGATVRRSLLLPGAVIRRGAQVEDSIVGEGALVQEGARVAALSVIGADAVVDPDVCMEGERVPA